MDKSFLVQLTNNVYRLTLLFPKKEPLRYKIRELSDNVLADPNIKDLEALDSFFDVALAQNWVSPSEILAIKRKYDNLKKTLEKDGSVSLEAVPEKIPALSRDNFPRKERIIEFLKENSKAQVWQIKQIMPEISKRTLRRDFEAMIEQGLIERIGERNDTFYQIKTKES